MLFTQLFKNEKILKALDELGYEQPTEIQKLVFEKFNN